MLSMHLVQSVGSWWARRWASASLPRRGILIDLGIGVCLTAVMALAITANVGGSRSPIWAYAFALAFGALMLVRRTFPVLTLLVTALGLLGYYALDLPPVGLAIPVAAALYSAAVVGRLRWAVGVAMVLVAVSTAFRLWEGDDPDVVIGIELASNTGLMVAALALGDGVRSRRMVRTELGRRAQQAALDERRDAARRVEAERLWIARELHDVLGHTVTVISLQSSVAAEALTDDDRGATAAALGAIRTASTDAMTELRATVGSLRNTGSQRSPADGLDQLERLVSTVASSGLSVTVNVDGDPVPLPVIVDTTAYRIIQESLTNTLRHARATRAEVRLSYEMHALQISVVDNGQGGHTTAGSGQGLRGMIERAALLGGSVRAGHGAHGGFRVDASLPLTTTGRSVSAQLSAKPLQRSWPAAPSGQKATAR